MIARCESCALLFLEIDSRKLESPIICATCAIDDIERAESERIAAAAQALQVIAPTPASWGGALLRIARGNRKRAR